MSYTRTVLRPLVYGVFVVKCDVAIAALERPVELLSGRRRCGPKQTTGVSPECPAAQFSRRPVKRCLRTSPAHVPATCYLSSATLPLKHCFAEPVVCAGRGATRQARGGCADNRAFRYRRANGCYPRFATSGKVSWDEDRRLSLPYNDKSIRPYSRPIRRLKVW